MPATMLQASGRHPLLPCLAARPAISSQSHFVVACTSTSGGGGSSSNPEQDNGIGDSGAKGIDQHHELRKRVSWFEDKHNLGRSVGWFIDRASALPSLILSKGAARNVKGLWDVCDACGAMLYARSEGLGKRICHECGHHLRRGSSDRIEQLIDPGTWVPLDEDMVAVDVLRFRDEEDYSTRLSSSRKRSGLTDAVQTGLGEISGMPVALGVMDFRFMGGSMGSVVGEKITRLVEAATASRRPLIIICSSGGARMQEGALSLMQMAKVSAALEIHQAQEGLLYIPILTNPTTGGITASFGMLGDIIIAEPKAYIAFAGGRVIKQTLQLGSNLPQGFQVAEYVFEHGLLDLIVPGSLMKGCLKEIFALYEAAPCKRMSKAV